MNTKALVAVIAFVAAASAMAQFKAEGTQVASVNLGGTGLSLTGSTPSTLAFESTGRSTARLGNTRESVAAQGAGEQAAKSERLSFPEPGNLAMLLAGLGVIGFVAGRRQQN
jgi:maltoporin